MNKEISSLLDILQYSVSYLAKNGIANPRLNAELLLSKVMLCKRIDLYLQFDKPLNVLEKEQYKSLLRRRVKGEPLQYILGETDFFGYKIAVSEGIFIPRPDTEILVEAVLNYLTGIKIKPLNILEIGTGSGCVALSVAGELIKSSRDFKMSLIDVNPYALKNAKKNFDSNLGSYNNINFILGDILTENINFFEYDVIFSNPPYIPISEYNELDIEVRNYEPKNALTDNDDGLRFLKRYLELLGENKKTKLFVEIGYNQKSKIENLMFKYSAIKYNFIKDYSGINRVIVINL